MSAETVDEETADVVEECRQNVELVADTEADQRKREIAALEFQVPQLQWDEKSKAARQGGPLGEQILPGRPMLSIPKLDGPVQLQVNQMYAAHLGINIYPVNETSSRDIAKVFQGVYRAIERDSHAEDARGWAFDRAVKAGFGVWRVRTVWDDDSDNLTDQKIVIERVLDQASVFLDPTAQKIDWSDGLWGALEVWLTRSEFKRTFPKSLAALAGGSEFEALFTDAPGWVKTSGKSHAVRVVEYFKKENSNERELTILPDGTICDLKEKCILEVKAGTLNEVMKLPPSLVIPKDAVTRPWADVAVKIHKITGCDPTPIETDEWNGRYIPLIPVVGRELQVFNGERRRVGLIEPAMDGQRFYNFAASSVVERIALEPKAPAVGTKEQFKGYEALWQQINTRNLAMLPYNPHVFQGSLVPPPGRMQVDASGMNVAMLAVQEADSFIKSATGVFDPSLGELSPKDRSGRAIMALQGQAEQTNNHFMKGLLRAMNYEGRCIVDAIPRVYDRPGRRQQVIDDEGNESRVALNIPYKEGENEGDLEVLNQLPEGQPLPEGAKFHDLSAGGRYGVEVTAGKSHDTRLQQGREELGQLLQASPEQMMIWGDIYMRFRDTPGAEQIADRIKKMIEKNSPGLTEEPGDKPDAQVQLEQLQAENDQLKQVIEEGTKRLEELESGIAKTKLEGEIKMATEQARAQSQLVTEQARAQSQLATEQVQGQVKLAIEQAQAQARLELEQFKAAAEAALEEMKQRFELVLQTSEQHHEARLEGARAAHEVIARREAAEAAEVERDEKSTDSGEKK